MITLKHTSYSTQFPHGTSRRDQVLRLNLSTNTKSIPLGFNYGTMETKTSLTDRDIHSIGRRESFAYDLKFHTPQKSIFL